MGPGHDFDADDLLSMARRSFRQIAVMTGAGISAESGIPTFRGSDGLWRGLDPLQLATPKAFAADPALVWGFYHDRRSIVHQAKPNAGHIALVELADRVESLTVITQNVDRLHHRAGSLDVIELHGNLEQARCTGCGRTEDHSGVALPPLPSCSSCQALLRPAVVWFGEALPAAAWDRAIELAQTVDLFVVIGTSSVVYPAASLVQLAQQSRIPTMEINLEPTPISEHVTLAWHGQASVLVPKLLSYLQ